MLRRFRPRISAARIESAVPIALCFLAAAGNAVAAEHWDISTTLISPNPAIGAHYGAAVAMSGDTLAIGEPYYSFGSLNAAGAVHVYQRNGTAWNLIDTLTGFAPQDDAHFGAAVAVSGDNLLIGVPDADDGAHADSGAVFFYRRNAATGHWLAMLNTVSTEAGGHFGSSVAISATQAAAGSPNKADGSTANAGLVSAWEYANDSWQSLGEFGTSAAAVGSHLGASVALIESSSAATGPLLVAGAPGFNGATNANIGALFVFWRPLGRWEQTQRLLESNPQTEDKFGTSVALSASRIFGGSIQRDNPGGTTQTGSVSVFLNGTGSYAFEDELFATGGSTGASFGKSLAFHFDGVVSRLLVGSPLGNQSPTTLDSGAAFVFERFGSPIAWRQDDRLSLGQNAFPNDQLGAAVAVAGKFAAVGVPLKDGGPVTDCGVVQIFAVDTIFTDGFE